jgi:membrane-associated HD superfamily phosphohydrolase
MGDDSDENGSKIVLFSIIAGIVTTLLFGSYVYTWSESNGQDVEKREWRKEHQQVLDKRFEEIKQGQKEISAQNEKNYDRTQELLQQLVEEQKKTNEKIQTQQQRSHK